ncbi:flavohemoglobin expression-modulating QEGLA motif protein [Pseudochelatococcus sp. B33]
MRMAEGTQSAKEPSNDPLIAEIVDCLRSGKAVRRELPDGGRLHIDRPLPFLCLHIMGARDDTAARDIASAHASYLVARDLGEAALLVDAVGAVMQERFGAFIVLDVGELEHDIFLADDSPYLPHYEVSVSASHEPRTRDARRVFVKAIRDAEVRFRTPRVTWPDAAKDPLTALRRAGIRAPCIAARFAPIYRQPESGVVYPGLRERLVANVFDACLQAFEAFAASAGALTVTTHRALGRKAFIDAVRRLDRSIDDIVTSFDFLPALTPINAGQAWLAFRESGFKDPPRFYYRPLSVDVEAQKCKLYAAAFEHLEDPVLYQLFREKQQEVDLQLTMLSALHTRRFTEFSRALYGPVEPALLTQAKAILAALPPKRRAKAKAEPADCETVAEAARLMIEAYRADMPEFNAGVEIRSDLPAGLMVTGSRLLVASTTVMDRGRIHALLCHEVGVHLLTYFNGSVQGLRLFRSGLAGYEGVQEGLAVLAEYLAGGMTRERLRLIAGRVIGCAAMLDGATFQETFSLLTGVHGFDEPGAFNMALRIYRGGGLSKDAIYLRGLTEVLTHLRAGGALDPFWMGKIAADHFPVMQELALRGLLRRPAVQPAFLASPEAGRRLAAARGGLTIADMTA